MKKTISLILALMLCLSLCACSGEKLSLEERIPDEVTEYISTNYRIRQGISVSEPVNVDISSVNEMEKDSKWEVIGTYTVKIDKEIVSAKFGMVATYDEENDQFVFNNVVFDDFK